jgi:uncharacterized protein YwgA
VWGNAHSKSNVHFAGHCKSQLWIYKFVIYKHGPYSFDLSNELTEMRAAGILELHFPREGYGPSILATDFGERVYRVNKENVEKYDAVSKFLADWFSGSDVRHLERIATAYFVTAKNPRDPAMERARKLEHFHH